jgi:hypothetical protein
MTTFKLYETAAQIDAACIAFFKKGNALQTEAHKLACSVLKHVGEHGDVKVAAKFIASFPDMARTNAVRAWFEHFGPVAFDAKGVYHVKGKKTLLGEALDTPFWKFAPEPEYKPVDAAKAIEGLIKKLQRDAKETGTNHDATIAALRAVKVGQTVMQTEEAQEAAVPVLMIEHKPAQPTAH